MIQDQPDATTHALGLWQEIKFSMTVCTFLMGREDMLDVTADLPGKGSVSGGVPDITANQTAKRPHNDS